MAESNQLSNVSQPPPAPPLPPQRPGVLQRFIGPLAFNRPSRVQGAQAARSSSASPKDVSHNRPYRKPPQREAFHRTGIPIAAIDINESATHAILAGRDILKTVKVQDRTTFEDLNIRSAVSNYISTQPLKPDDIHKRREFLPAKDVRWSHKHYSHVVATAAQNGRVALYDVSRGSSRVELHHLYQHTGQVNKLDFDPHSGYMLLSGSQDKTCKIWDIREPKKPRGYAQFHVRAPVRDVRWSPTDAMEFALCTEDGAVQKWDIRTPQQALLGIKAHEKSCYTISWHPDGKHLVSGGVDKNLKVWDLKSQNRRQKPIFSLRCPAGIMNLAWRPPCWSAEFAERGTWQSTQIATSYTDDDPRIHVWDLRRPHIPFRELAQYDTRPMDLLWANKDLLWTAGGAGFFAQNDVSYAPQPEDSLPLGATAWAADGSFYAVTEERRVRRHDSATDPAAIFLNIPQERLSGTEDGLASRSLTDDEGTDTSFSEHTSRRQSKAASTRSVMSQANTPPTHDDFPRILPLDRAVMAKKDMFINGQLSALTHIPGLHLPQEVVDAIANGYARPMTAKEREAEPDQILPRLRDSFQHNAIIAQAASLHGTAGNWRLMGAVIIPELEAWADNNRKKRLDAEKTERQLKEDNNGKGPERDMLSPFAKIWPKDKDVKSPAQSEKVRSNLFRGVMEPERGSSDQGSHAGSNMTTPRQQPILGSPASNRPAGSTWFTLDDAIDPIQPLPPSLANAHSTAAKASRALLDTTSDPSESPLASPEKAKGHRRNVTESSRQRVSNLGIKDSPSSALKAVPTDDLPKRLSSRALEDRRAALKDYKAPARQPLSLDPPVQAPRYGSEYRHDSTESFPMFPASTSSSARADIGRSFEAAESMEEGPAVPRHDSDVWVQPDSYYNSVGRSDEYEESSGGSGGRDTQTADFAMDESPASMAFGLDGTTDSRPVRASESVEAKFREVLARSPRSKDELVAKSPVVQAGAEQEGNQPSTGGSRLDSLVEESVASYSALLGPPMHHFNPLLRGSSKDIESLSQIAEGDVSRKSSYQASDFRPIDITKYEPLVPWLFSAYHHVCQAIEADITEGTYGSTSSQFSAHLLSHIHPFFFHQSFRVKPTPADLANVPTKVADKLQHPAFSSRLIMNIFATHIERLTNLGLHVAANNLRKLAVEDFDYPLLAGPEARTRKDESTGETLKTDPRKLTSTCSECKQPMPAHARACKNCKASRDPCAICEEPIGNPNIIDANNATALSSTVRNQSNLASYCHACGHAGHLSCMSEWFSDPFSKGECPTGCGCDCAPGKLREERIARQIAAREEENAIRGTTTSSSMARKDPKMAGHSAAVDKARDTLRISGSGSGGPQVLNTSRERGTQSSDERTTPSSGSTAWSRSGGTSFGRRVRVVRPGEDE
ncbi:SEA (Seh1-associated) complex subunit [Knufia fluminis]|uniref:Restriction of telomere capping protein 1 n=1 Tax=Knufia fluminis TaxID=191047 RepID=A0AAN8EJ22_9EURO|nr:SEA (Seh1-associated) complex subunit [Knufia fluminis]